MRKALILTALSLLTACSADPATDVANVTDAPPLPASAPAAPYRNPACEGEREGQWVDGPGNRHVRYAGLCASRIYADFTATPEFQLTYSLDAYGCAAPAPPNWTAPAGFFERPVPEQIRILEAALTRDFRAVAAACDRTVDPAAFLGPLFTEFYENYGDGWWFSRLDGGIVLTPEKGTEYRNAQTH